MMQQNYKQFKTSVPLKFEGIINYLDNDLHDPIEITACSVYSNDPECQPINVKEYKDQNKYYLSKRQSMNWIQFYFENHRIIPTDYIIRTVNFGHIDDFSKKLILECSEDSINWINIETKGKSIDSLSKTYKFEIDLKPDHKSMKFQFLKLITYEESQLAIDSFEVFGFLY